MIRFIPALPGQPLLKRQSGQQTKVHPRATGAAPPDHAPRTLPVGSSPRCRGDPIRVKRSSFILRRFISALPGQSAKVTVRVALVSFHPRVPGVTVFDFLADAAAYGSSPLSRGNFGLGVDDDLPEGFIPAFPGQPLFGRNSAMVYRVHPRFPGATLFLRVRPGALLVDGSAWASMPVLPRILWYFFAGHQAVRPAFGVKSCRVPGSSLFL